MSSVIIDIRENKLIEQLNNLGFVFTTQSLDIGDIMITKQDHPFLIIERKTIDDLKASICDGRLREQRYRLLNGSGLPATRIMYIIEGTFQSKSNKRLIKSKEPLNNSTVLGSIINMLYRDNIKVHRTNSVEETAEFIIKLFSKIDDKEIFQTGLHLETNNEPNETKDSIDDETKREITYSSVIVDKKKKNNMTPNVWFVCQLSMIPQISDTIATAITVVYPSLLSLITAYQEILEEDRSSLLSNITYDLSSGKKRKVGPKISERVYQFIYNKL